MTVRPTTGFASGVLEGREAVDTLTFEADVESIDCGIGKMNKHLRKALKSGEFPVIRFDLDIYDVTPGDEGIGVRAEGTLTIAGVSRPVELRVDVGRDGEALRVTGMKPINMEDYGVEPPSLMLGTLRVDKQVHVAFDVAVRNSGLAATLGPDTESPN
jgi:polyisoprenoid-binding protein YceI